MKPLVISLRVLACMVVAVTLFASPSQAQVVINELHYHPEDPNGDAEFIELHNSGAVPVDISGWTLSGFAETTYTFPGSTNLAADDYVVVARDADVLQIVTGFLTPHEWGTGNLSNGGETVILSDDLSVEVDSVSYDDAPPWPAAPDGDGPSLELTHPDFDNSVALVWGASSVDNGTPGAQNSIFSESPVVLGEAPARLSVVETLPTVSVTFSEAVQNVAAGDLSVNGSPATSVTGSGAGPYEFSGFAAPTTAPITVDLAAGSIQDLDTNAFGGTSWLYPNVVINEIHYHPLDPDGDAEFIEVLNAGTIPADISGFLLDFGPVPFQFPGSTTLAAGDVTVVAMDPALLQSLTGYLAPHQWLAGALSNGGELITLSVSLGVEADRVNYGDRNDPPWPAEPDGEGPTLELVHPSLDNALALAWKASAADYGTPGATNSIFDAGPIVIAESPERGAFTGPGLTEISVTFHEEVTGLVASDLIVDGAAATGVSGSGAGPYVFTVPAPTSDQVPVTLGPGAIQDLAANPFSGDSWQYVVALPDILINELHYHPADSAVGAGEDPERLQFLELYNGGTGAVELTGWRLTDGVTFDFPGGTSIAAGEYILVAKDGTFLNTTVTTIPGGTQIFDWDGGDLSNGGEAVRLSDPIGNTIDRVNYNDEGVWPDTPDGEGPSLELINPLLLNQYSASWQGSAGTNGTPGELNSVFNPAPPPVIADVKHDPPIPAGGAPVNITAEAFDTSPFPITAVYACHRQDQQPTVGYTCALMLDDGLNGDGAAGDGLFGVTLAGLADGERMDFAIAASTGTGLTVAPRGHDCGLTPPATDVCVGDNPSQVFLVKFSDAGVPIDYPSYHLTMTRRTADLQGPAGHTKVEYDATMVHCQTDGSCEIHYNVIERYRGQSSLGQHPHSYNIRFPDNPIQSEMGFEIKELLMMGQQTYRQALGYDLFEGAGHPTPRHQFVRLVRDPVPHEGLEDYVYINIERVDDDFMRSQGGAISPPRFPDRCSISNTVCTTNLDCPGGETCEGTDRGNIYRGRRTDANLRWEGPGPPATHPGPYMLDGNDLNGYQRVASEDDTVWTDLYDLTDALTCSSSDGGSICIENTYDGSWESILPQYLETDLTAAWFGLHMLLYNSEGGLWNNSGDDYFVAFQSSLDHAKLITWDMDALFSNNTNYNIWSTNVPVPQRFLRHNNYAGYFVGEICRLLDNEFSVAAMTATINALPDVLFDQPEPQSPQGNGPRDKVGLINWVTARHPGILNQISTQTTLNGIPVSPYTDPNPVIALSGSLNQCGARRVRVNGIEADSYTIANAGASGADWSHSFTLVPGVNNIVVQTVDHDGNVIDSASDAVLYSPPGTGGEPVDLKVTGPTRMVNTKTHTVRAEILDALGQTYWQSWDVSGTISARLVSNQTPVPITVTVFETFNGGVGAGGPAPGEILFYNGLGSVSFTIDDPVSVAGQDIEVTVAAAGFSDSIVVTVLDETAPGLFKTLSGTLSGADLTWGPSDGVIHLTGNVDAGSNTLTINPGTLIMVDSGPPTNGTQILVPNGNVQALGSELNPIFFFPTEGPAAMSLPQQTTSNPPSWRGIDHRGSGTSNYQHVFLTGAGNGVVSGHPRPVILGFFASHSFNITNCVFADDPGKVVHGGGSGNYYAANSLFSRTGIGGEFFGAGHDLLIDYCWFTRSGRAPEAFGVDGDALHLDTFSTTQLIRSSIIADCGDDAIDHSSSFPVIQDTIIWDVRDKSASLTGGGITFDNVLAFRTGQGIRGGTGTVVVRNSTIASGSSVTGVGPVTIDETITTTSFNTGSCSGNVNYTLGPNANHFLCGVGNISGNPGFQDPNNCDYSLQEGSQAATAGPTGGRIGWLGFPTGLVCVNDAECDDDNACTSDTCDAGACSFVPIDGCIPCDTDGECDDSNPCTVDSCSAGVCVNPAGNDGASCDDGLACTDNDICGAGTCLGTDTCPIGQVCGPTGVCILGQTTFVFQDDGTTYTGTQDAHVREAAPDATHGTPLDTCDSGGPVPCDFFEWDAEDPAPFQNLGLIKFEDINGPGLIPQGSLIESATLTLVLSDPAGTPATIHPMLVDWDETTVTWNNIGGEPALQPEEYGPQVALAPTATGTAVIDITSAVQAWVNDSNTNFGLVFLPTSNNGAQVRSSEYTVNVAERPILTVNLPDTGCLSDIDCNDGVYCNGVETCDLGSSTCLGGTPIECDDSVGCTTDSCNEGLQICDNVPTNSLCDDGLYCTGVETCDAVLDCQTGTPVDCGAQLCSDPLAQCVDCLSDLDCPVGEVCTMGTGTCGPPTPADPLPIQIGDEFLYFKGTEEPAPGGGGAATTDWALLGYDDSSWLAGDTGFAYGSGPHEALDPDTNTVIDDMQNNYVSLYFRREFHIDNPAAVDTMTLTMEYDDGFVAYVNGVEVLRSNLLVGLGDPPAFDQLANSGGTNHEGDVAEVFDLAVAIPELFAGTNVLAIQLHNVTLTSSDMVMRPLLDATFISLTCTGDIDCDDGAYCNGAETCNLTTFLCEAGVPVDCDDGVNCTVDTCNETTDSCDNTPDDLICNDGNVCTDNTCDPVLGCETENNTADCEDGDACTENDVCSGGGCQPGTTLDCNDGVTCTIDSCDTIAGCQYEDDCPVGEFCNTNTDVCESGPQPGDLIISGFNGSNNANEWIELFNTTSQTISLANVDIINRLDLPLGAPDGTLDIDWQLSTEPGVVIPPTLEIQPHSFLLIGEGAAPTLPGDLALTSGQMDLSTGEMGIGELTMSMELTLDGLHMDYLLYGDNSGSNPPIQAPGDISWDGVTERAEVIRPVFTPAAFNEGPTWRASAADLYAGHDVDGYYTDETSLPGTYPAGVWTSDHENSTPFTDPRNTGTTPVLPPSPDCTSDAQCDDLLYCNGVETCNLTTNLCEAGTPVDCDDGIACNVDSCNETTDMCESSLCPMDVVSIGGRYLAITPPAGLSAVALRVDSAAVSCLPQYVDENGFLDVTPVYRTSAEWGTIFVGDREILPSTTYDVAAEVAGPQDVGLDSATTWLWGDVNNVDGAEVLDIMCVQDGFAGSFTLCTLEGEDVRAGIPDRAIDLDDLLATLDGVALLPYPDSDPCSGPPPAPALASGPAAAAPLNDVPRNVELAGTPGGGSVDETNLITLVPSADTIETGQELRVDVFVRETSNLRGYQVALEVLGGAEGLLLTEGVEIASTREDYVFAERGSHRVTDLEGTRLGAALGEGGVESYDPIYLGTFVFRATETAEGTYVIRFVETGTFLRDDFARPIERKLGEDIEVEVSGSTSGSTGGAEFLPESDSALEHDGGVGR